jgi:hypothetical protein
MIKLKWELFFNRKIHEPSSWSHGPRRRRRHTGPPWTSGRCSHQSGCAQPLRGYNTHRDGMKIERGRRRFSPRSSVAGAVTEEGRQCRSTVVVLRPQWQSEGDTERWRKWHQGEAWTKCSRKGSLYRAGSG